MKNPTISLCMIVKNEQELLSQCLDSVRDLVDEMIIVDTGSTDKTVEIAESYGAQVYHHPWQGSFSEARNYGLQFATSEWILQLDADEKLEKEDIPLLRHILRTSGVNAVFVAILNETDGGWAKHSFQRIFRRGTAHYEGIVHNQLKHSGAFQISEIRVYHYGYNLAAEKMQAKFARTEKLLSEQIQADKTDPFVYENYLRILRSQRRFEDAVSAGKRALVICRERMHAINRQMIVYDTAYCLVQLLRSEEAEEMCRDELQRHPKNLDLLFTLGSSLLGQQRLQEAIEIYLRFLQVIDSHDQPHPQLICDTWTMAHKAYSNIADCLVSLERYPEAKNAIEKAMAERPQESAYKISYARILAHLGQFDTASAILKTETLHRDVTDHYYQLWAALCRAFPQMGASEAILRDGLDKHPDSVTLNNQLAFDIWPQEPQMAERCWETVLSCRPIHLGAHAGLAKIALQRGKVKKLEKHALIILSKCQQSALLKSTARDCVSARLFQLAIELYQKSLQLDAEDLEALLDLSTTYMMMGQHEAAWVGYREAYQRQPDHPVLRRNMKALQAKIEQKQHPSPTNVSI